MEGAGAACKLLEVLHIRRDMIERGGTSKLGVVGRAGIEPAAR
jgi:hypothetical protein